MMAAVIRPLLAVLFCGTALAQPAAPDVWAPVRFLIGQWEGAASGKPGKGTTQREYRFALNQRFIEARNKTTFPAQPQNPKGEVHEDWGMLSFDRARKLFVLRQFHVEGFVNQYTAGAAPGGVLRFISESIENIPAGWRARETMTVTGPDTFTETFELAQPGQEFEIYEETRFQRRK
jgi:hypothetical protein